MIVGAEHDEGWNVLIEKAWQWGQGGQDSEESRHVFIECVQSPHAAPNFHQLDDELIYKWVGCFWCVLFCLVGDKPRADQLWKTELGDGDCPSITHLKALILNRVDEVRWRCDAKWVQRLNEIVAEFCNENVLLSVKQAQDLVDEVNIELRNSFWLKVIMGVDHAMTKLLIVGADHVTSLIAMIEASVAISLHFKVIQQKHSRGCRTLEKSKDNAIV